MSYLSRTVYPAVSGSTSDFALSFGYLLPAHVSLVVKSPLGVLTVLAQGTGYTFTSSSVVHTTAPPAGGSTVSLIRTTPAASALVTFQPGSPTSSDLNTDFLQLLYLEQETKDALADVAAQQFLGDLTAAQLAAQGAQAALATVQAQVALAAASASQANTSAGLAGNYAALLAAGPKSIFPSTVAAMSNGVQALGSLVGGSGGTNGTFDVAFSGGGGTGATARFTVVGGIVATLIPGAAGSGYSSNPAMSFAASSGLTGASAVASTAPNAPVGTFFYVTNVDHLEVWQNLAGLATLFMALPNLGNQATLGQNTALTLGMPIDGATTVTIGNLTGSTDATSLDDSYLTDPAPCDGYLAALRVVIGAAGAAASRIHFDDPATGPDIALASFIVNGALPAGLATIPFSPPLFRKKGSRIAWRTLSGSNLLSRLVDNGAQFIAHGFGVGVESLGVVYQPQASPSSPAMNYDFFRVDNNIDTRLRKVEARPRIITPYHERILINDDLRAGLPGGYIHGGGTWGVSGGRLVGPAAGNGTYAVSGVGPASHARRTFELDFFSPSSADCAALVTRPITGTNYGGVALKADRTTGRFGLFGWTGPGDNGTFSGLDGAFPPGGGAKELTIRVVKDNFTHTLSLLDRGTGFEQVLQMTHNMYNLFAFALFHGDMGFASFAGAPGYEHFRVIAPYAASVYAVFMGTSMTDFSGIGMVGEESAPNILARSRNDIVVAGRSGDTSTKMLARLQVDCLNFVPEWAIFEMVPNDSVLADWEANLDSAILQCRNAGVQKIALVAPPPAAVNQTWLNQARAALYGGHAFGADCIVDWAAALTTNQDTVTLAPGMFFGDHRHPSGYAQANAILSQYQRAIPGLAL